MALTPTEDDISTAFGNLSLISNSENMTITEYEPKIMNLKLLQQLKKYVIIKSVQTLMLS